MVPVAALIVHHAEADVCQLLDGALDCLVIGDSPAHDLHLRAVQRPLIGSGIGQHGPPVVHQEAHGSGQVADLSLRLRHDSGNIYGAHQRLRGCYARKVYDLPVIPLVPLHYLVQQLVQLLPGDVGGLLDGFLDLAQVDTVGA